MSTKQLAYFDNAATSFPKPEVVYQFADSFYRSNGVNIGRGQYSLATKAATFLEETRELLLSLYGCKGKQVLFTASATEAINKILLGLNILPKSTVYVSPFEHNAVTRVLHGLQDKLDINMRVLPFNRKSLLFDENRAEAEFRQFNPDVIVMTHASNVCGVVLPVTRICELAKRFQAKTIVDMSQTAGLLDLQLSTASIDFAVFAGHKSLLAPFGVGGFICSENTQLEPVFFGGTGIDSISQGPSTTLRGRIEVGSQNVYAIAGLNAALKWITDNGISKILSNEKKNTDKLLEILRSYENLTIIADEMKADRIGVVSTLFNNYSPDEIGKVLSGNGVAVRTGLHCSPYAHDFLGTSPSGTVRFSVSCLTTDEDFRMLETALNKIVAEG